MKTIIVIIVISVFIQCSCKLEDKIDFTFDERAKFDGEIYIYTNRLLGEYPGINKLYDESKHLIIFSLFFSPNLQETLDVENKTIINIKYRTESGDPPISYEEACEIVREYQYDMRESITLEDCYGFWGKYARRLGLIETKKGF
jgi:hypothetical protein